MTVSPQESTGRAMWLPLGIIAALFVVRVLAVFQHPFDSDEGQHLHMIYGWASGELPYRDRFDNHTPLLYLLYRPLAAWAGETPWIIEIARAAIFPVSALMLGFIYLIARKLAGRETALWTVAMSLALADWSMKSVEFRPDVVWAALWFMTLWVLVNRMERPGGWAGFLAGITLGAALCASIKTTFLAPGLVVGWGGIYLVSPDFRRAFPPRRLAIFLALAAAGFVMIPALVFGGFLSWGTSPARLKFCLFEANRAPFELGRMAASLALAPVAMFVAWRVARRGGLVNATAAAVFLSGAAFAIALIGFSPELRKQTFLPVYPLLILFVCREGAFFLRKRRPALFPVLASIAVAAAFTHLLVESPPWRDGLAGERNLLKDTLALTRPGEPLLDLKGETIFRRRPIFDVYQHASVRAINEGRLPEPNPRRLARQGTAVVIGSTVGFTDSMKAYLKEHYVPAGEGNLRVAGQLLKPSWQKKRWLVREGVPVPGEYVLVRDGVCLGVVNVKTRGAQLFDFGGDRLPRMLFWKKAWDAGYAPQEKTR